MLTGILLEVPVCAAGAAPSCCYKDSRLFLEGKGRCVARAGWVRSSWTAGTSTPLSLKGDGGQGGSISGVVGVDLCWEDAASVLGMLFPRWSFFLMRSLHS